MLGIYSKIVNALPLRVGAQLLPSSTNLPCWQRARFTHPMCDSRVPSWRRVLAPHRDRIRDVLEIGSYEGQSALFWLDFFPRCHLTCIDPWADPRQLAPESTSMSEVEANFDFNLQGQARKIKGYSSTELPKLGPSSFDLIYIDGDHRKAQVLSDSHLAWPLLRSGGILIWDDYRTYQSSWPEADRPAPAIDEFIALQGPALRILADTGQQLFSQKRVLRHG